MMQPNYRLRSISFQQQDSPGVVRCVNKEPLNKPFVIISALTFSLTYHNLDVLSFIYDEMGFADQTQFLKKMSLLPVVGSGGDTAQPQLWMHTDLTEFEMSGNLIALRDITAASDFPIVHILEKIS